MAPPRKILIDDSEWREIVIDAKSKLAALIEKKHPHVYAKAKRSCESGMMADPPCSACLFKAAASYGLTF